VTIPNGAAYGRAVDVDRARATARRQAPLFSVLALVALGLIIVATDHWARGVVVVSLALLLGAGMRLLLPTRRVGLLVVRSRAFDVAALLTVSGLLLGLSLSLR
jgi:hypothetical protein